PLSLIADVRDMNELLKECIDDGDDIEYDLAKAPIPDSVRKELHKDLLIAKDLCMRAKFAKLGDHLDGAIEYCLQASDIFTKILVRLFQLSPNTKLRSERKIPLEDVRTIMRNN